MTQSLVKVHKKDLGEEEYFSKLNNAIENLNANDWTVNSIISFENGHYLLCAKNDISEDRDDDNDGNDEFGG